jgi:hypothetical protein
MCLFLRAGLEILGRVSDTKKSEHFSLDAHATHAERTRSAMADHPIPDDVATMLLRLVQDGGEIKIVEVLGDSEDGAVTFVLECKRTATSRALACINKQFARTSPSRVCVSLDARRTSPKPARRISLASVWRLWSGGKNARLMYSTHELT